MLGLCDRFRCVPEQAYRMDASVLRLLDIEAFLGWREEVTED